MATGHSEASISFEPVIGRGGKATVFGSQAKRRRVKKLMNNYRLKCYLYLLDNLDSI